MADEWIRKLWYIYTIEYYSAIKKNTFESVLMRWMIISVSQPRPWRREWLSTQELLPGEFRGQRSLVGDRLWGHKELDTTEQLN